MLNRSAALRLVLAVCLSAVAMPGFAQTTDESEPEPAHLAYIDGAATVVRDGRAEDATINVPLIAGDQLRTREGRVEVLFGDGSVLDADHFTSIDFLSDALLRLLEGRVRLTIGGRDRVAYRIDTPSGAVRIDAPGEYRVALVGESGRMDVELVTVRGFATLINDLGETSVRAGERAFATAGMAPSYAQAYNSASWDAFDRWAADRRDERTGSVSSAEYLPSDVRMYASDFDRYGDWRYETTYGYVWYPRVHVGWRPYYYGRWSYYGPWGWTWIAYDRWGWPTHHYGRWGFSAGVWFWIPSRRWAPAYVYWAGASDYIGWCPLGWDNRPIFSLINVNIHTGRGYRGYRGYDPYYAWTVVPRRAFSSHVEVSRYAVNRTDLDRAVPRWYVSGASAPIRPAVAARSTAPIYSAGRAAPSRANVSSVPGGSQRSAPRAWGSGATPSGWTAAEPERARSRSEAAPRATAPSTTGSLGPSTSWRRSRDADPGGQPSEVRDGREPSPSRSAPQAVPRYRDMGPGGREPGAVRSAPREVGAPRGVPDDSPAYAPRGVPDNSRIYTPRAVPRDDGMAAPPRDAGDSRPAYRAPMREPARERPEYRSPERSAPREWSAPAPRGGPDRSAPRGPSAAPAPSGGRERAAPRGGSSAPGRPRGGDGGERAHSRRPQ